MSQYSGMFISCLVVSLLINFGCNSKSSKNLSDSDFKKKIFREYRPKGNIKIKFNHNNIPSATCSKYKIIAERLFTK